jgi:hypothetical protein
VPATIPDGKTALTVSSENPTAGAAAPP